MSADVLELPTAEASFSARVGGGQIDTDTGVAIVLGIALAALVGLRIGWPSP